MVTGAWQRAQDGEPMVRPTQLITDKSRRDSFAPKPLCSFRSPRTKQSQNDFKRTYSESHKDDV